MIPDWREAYTQVARRCIREERHRLRTKTKLAWTAQLEGEHRRRYLVVPLAITFMLIFSLLGPGRFTWGAAAQEATPPTVATPPAAGVTIELLDTGEPVDTPGKVLNFVRLTFEPGGYLSAHGHPGAQVWYVSEGAVSTTVLEGTIRLTRPPDRGTPVPAEEIGPGMEASVTIGESMYFDRDVIHTLENVGDEPAVILIAAVLDAGVPEVIFTEHGGHEEATPPS